MFNESKKLYHEAMLTSYMFILNTVTESSFILKY